jgi:predicted ATPase/DNA-binding winged helix-turn-helix (wHTH) protein
VLGQAAVKDDAMVGPAAESEVISFGRFRLVPSQRLLTNNGVPVDVGARALDVLIALVSRPNQVVGKRALMAQAWPDVTVEEGSLRFHIASLRKVLGEGKDGARYIATLPGRGYCFVAPVSQSCDLSDGSNTVASSSPFTQFLPTRLVRMVGRADCIQMLSTQLAASRFVTIVGTGGVGKTTVAVAIAHDLLETFDGAVLFVDFGVLSDPRMLPASVASMLGISVQSDDPVPSLVAYIRAKRILMILDGCEHVIEAAARLAERVFLAAPQLHILATSREPLRVEGEQVHRLMPLAVPPDDPTLTAAIALTFPAAQLFVERATASGAYLNLTDTGAAIVATICRKLDGIALAIELAAGRVQAYGLQQTAALLEQHVALLWPGKRTAPPRQRTLQATLDWSYALLSEPERVIFRRLGAFVGDFTIEAALEVVTSGDVDQADVLGVIDGLVAKSMVTARPAGATMRYRLLDTARTYAREIITDDTERTELAARHATYWRRWLEQAGAEWTVASSYASERAPQLFGLNDVRAALEWCFGSEGNTDLGVRLAAAAAPALLALSLLTECLRWSERAILALSDTTRGGAEEMHLQAALGMSLAFASSNSEAARVALDRSLVIAGELGDVANQLRQLAMLHMFHHRIGDFETALHYARRCRAVSRVMADPASLALAHSLLGISLRFRGDLQDARDELEAALRYQPKSQRSSPTYLGFDYYAWTSMILAMTQWLQGHPAQAVERVRQTLNDAERLGHPVTLAIALVSTAFVFLWTGDLQSAEEHTAWLIAHADSHSLAPYHAAGRGLKAQLAIRRGDAAGGVETLRVCLDELHAERYELLTTAFNISLVQGLAAIGQSTEGLTLIEETIGREANGDIAYLPELQRVKGGVILSMPQPNRDAAERCFRQSLDLSRRQGARAWELRTAVDLAALWASQGRPAEAKALLQPVFEQFVEGADTADLGSAERLLASLG